MGWSWTPDGIKATLIEISQKYPDIPVFVSENGSCYNDGPLEDGKIHDAKRDEYLSLYIKSCVEAYKSGVNLKGYYLWSLLDNFEWAYGYGPTFGLVGVNRETQERHIKPSARWLGEVARANALLPLA